MAILNRPFQHRLSANDCIIGLLCKIPNRSTICLGRHYFFGNNAEDHDIGALINATTCMHCMLGTLL